MKKLIKLYYVPKNSRIDIEHLGLSLNGSDEIIKEVEFYLVDGMYAHCSYKNTFLYIDACSGVYLID